MPRTVEDRLEEALDEMERMAEDVANARALMVQMDAAKKSTVALAMKEAEKHGAKSAAAQEREAYASEQYQVWARGMVEATRDYESKRLAYEVKRCRWDTWRSRLSFKKAEMELR